MNHPLRLRIYGRANLADSPADLPAGGRAGEPLHVSLEDALANLEQLPRMFVEPDGSFLWTSGAVAPDWRLEGTIYDDGRVVRYMDLCGDCPLAAWKSFLSAFDETFNTVTLQLVENDLIVPGEWLEQRLASED